VGNSGPADAATPGYSLLRRCPVRAKDEVTQETHHAHDHPHPDRHLRAVHILQEPAARDEGPYPPADRLRRSAAGAKRRPAATPG